MRVPPALAPFLGVAFALLPTRGSSQVESSPAATAIPARLVPWLGDQTWQRDTEGPVLSLGEPGAFDDTHLFGPAVAVVDGRYHLWYCGSTGTARDLAEKPTPDHRRFQLGLALSDDGKTFLRHGEPVLGLDAGNRSVLTPSILRNGDGTVLREDGRIRMWFTSAAFAGNDRPHRIQEAISADGITWSEPSPPQLESAYAPSVVRVADGYAMWFTRPGRYPWNMHLARSTDGRKWDVRTEPVLEPSQPWEHLLQIYPHVLVVDGVYLMWYASYASADRKTTAIGFAASEDGVTWFKHPRNPVLQPDPSRSWESQYVSSQSVVRLADGSFRMWYASRKAPPFDNLYFAIGTARWSGPAATRDRR